MNHGEADVCKAEVGLMGTSFKSFKLLWCILYVYFYNIRNLFILFNTAWNTNILLSFIPRNIVWTYSAPSPGTQCFSSTQPILLRDTLTHDQRIQESNHWPCDYSTPWTLTQHSEHGRAKSDDLRGDLWRVGHLILKIVWYLFFN